MQNLSLSDLPDEEGTSKNGIDSVQSATNDGMEFVPPQHLLSDYVEIAYLGIVICAGLVLNISVLKRLLLERRRAQRSNKVMNGFLLLKLNLNLSDILILLIHASGKLGWLITYEWRGGDLLCRLFNLLSMFTLYLSSNIVICIALDRLCTVLTARRMDLGKQKLNLVRLMLILAWTFSMLFSLPQLFVWTTYNPFKDTTSRGWVQCTDIWSIDRYERHLSEQLGKNVFKNATITTARGGHHDRSSSSWATTLILLPLFQNTYELSHLFLVFYGPLIVLVFCYVIISSRLIRFAANNPNTSAHTIKNSSSNNDNFPPAVSYTSAERRLMFKRSIARTVPSTRLYNSAKWRRKSHLCNNQQLHLLQHSPLMDIVELSLVKVDEASNGTIGRAAETTTIFSSCREQTTAEMPENQDSSRGYVAVITEKHHSSLMVNSSLGKSAISLPIVRSDDCLSTAVAVVRPSASSDQLANPRGGVLPSLGVSSFAASLASRCATRSHSRNSMSCCSSTILSSHDLKMTDRHEKQKKPKQQLKFRSGRTRRSRVLYRIRDSFRDSFGKRKWHRRSRLDDAELTNSVQCLSPTNSLFENCAKYCGDDRDRRNTLPENGFSSADYFCCRFCCCPSFVQWVGRMKRIKVWKKNESQLMSARGSMALSVGGVRQNQCITIGTAFDPADILDGSSVPPTPHARPPSCATAYPTVYHQQNGGGDVTALHSVQKVPLFSRNHSVRSSYSTTISIVLHQNGKSADTDRQHPKPSSGHFLWRHRSRAFRTTLLVILVHILLWSPYNVYALMKHINEQLYQRMNEQANVLKHLQFLITLINPFLYGFGRNTSGCSGRGKAAVRQRHEKKPKGQAT